MRDKNEGQSLSAIVAAETTEGRWRGGGSGVGVGSGGIGVFTGGASGSSTSTTQRAKTLSPPERPSYDWWGVNGQAVKFAAGMLFLAGTFPVVEATLFAGSQPDVLIQAMGKVLPFAAIGSIIFAVIWMSGNNNAARQEATRLKKAEARFSAELAVYQRLRYVEADHVVFDPETGDEVPAERADVLRLIAKNAAIGEENDGGRT